MFYVISYACLFHSYVFLEEKSINYSVLRNLYFKTGRKYYTMEDTTG